MEAKVTVLRGANTQVTIWLQKQAEVSFKMGGENEKTKIRTIYKDAGDLKELETHNLLPNCIPHHLNGIKDDDRPDNLIEVSKSEHARIHNNYRQYKRGKSDGIKEVVEWVKDNLIYIALDYDGNPVLYLQTNGKKSAEKWQEQLKEWGI